MKREGLYDRTDMTWLAIVDSNSGYVCEVYPDETARGWGGAGPVCWASSRWRPRPTRASNNGRSGVAAC
jgi:hypothetical protein